MSIGILTDRDTNQSVMFCNTSEIAFGPVFGEDEDPQDFLDWLADSQGYTNPRRLKVNDLVDWVDKWRKQVEENEAEASGEKHFTEPGAWSGGFARNN